MLLSRYPNNCVTPSNTNGTMNRSENSILKIINKLTKDNFLTEEELDIVKRGRNNKKENHPKNTDIITYKLSTGFEALLGDLYLNNKDRLKEILEQIEVK